MEAGNLANLIHFPKHAGVASPVAPKGVLRTEVRVPSRSRDREFPNSQQSSANCLPPRSGSCGLPVRHTSQTEGGKSALHGFERRWKIRTLSLEAIALPVYRAGIQSIRAYATNRSAWFQPFYRALSSACLPAFLLAWAVLSASAQQSPTSPPKPAVATNQITTGVSVLAIEGETNRFQIQRAGSTEWDPGYVGQVLRPGDQGRTGLRTRVSLRLTDLSVIHFAEDSRFTIQQPPKTGDTPSIGFWRGLLYLFHRDKPGSTTVDTVAATAATRGTEFVLAVNEATSEVKLEVLAGGGVLRNPSGEALVDPGQSGSAIRGQAPILTGRIDARRSIQWVLYYPAVIAPSELLQAGLLQTAPQANTSLQAYQTGDLRRALTELDAAPGLAGVVPSPIVQIYRSALLLGLGQVQEAESRLNSISNPASAKPDPRVESLAATLKRLITVVRDDTLATAPNAQPESASQWLVESYAHQGRGDLNQALIAAQKAVAIDSSFGFGWARVADLEFGRGHSDSTTTALSRARTLAPDHASIYRLDGFLAASQRHWTAAMNSFDRAIALDPGLGESWLGRGLCRIRQGDAQGGREDLLMAAALEPQRSILRSYLGKAFAEEGDLPRAAEELRLARELDPNDPTPWLYSGLLEQNRHRYNQAVRDLQHSIALNENRSLYRSRLLLDQDRAVRGANLAGAYQEAGLEELATREAGRAVASDYANYSSHLFLANSYDRLRDPRQSSLRYESPWLSEYLMANLLAPASAGTLSQAVSQQEYSRFFEKDGIGLVNSTEYLSRGDWLQSAVQYGRFGSSSYALGVDHRSENGERTNEDLTQTTLSLQLKQEFGPRDRIYIQAVYYDFESGDLTPRYNPASANPGLRVKENQEPQILLGYSHEWSPGVHTLFLGGVLTDDYQVNNPTQSSFSIGANFFGPLAFPTTLNQQYRSQLQIYTAELQQIIQTHRHTWVMGGRVQWGDFDSENTYLGTAQVGNIQRTVSPFSSANADLSRQSVYVYDHWQILPSLTLIGGLTYDQVHYPKNYRSAPLANGEDTRSGVSPKLGLVWAPAAGTTLRGAFARSLGGVSFDQSFQLEPSQIAGLNQQFRGVIPDAVAGAQAAPRYDVWSFAAEQRLTTNTWVGLGAEILESNVEQYVGAFDLLNNMAPLTLRQQFQYQERSLSFYAYQLIGQDWSVGIKYRISDADLDSQFPDYAERTFPSTTYPNLDSVSAVLQQTRMFLQFQHPSGFFATGEALWFRQSNTGYAVDLPGDDFWQFNVQGGYRFPKRTAEIRLGILNLTDRDYRLNPLNLTAALPRARTLAVSLRFHF